MDVSKSFEGFKLTLLQTLKEFRYQKTIELPSKGIYIFEFFRGIDENKKHILYLERHIDEKGLFDESYVRKFNDYVKFELAYQVKKGVADLVIFEEGHLEEGIEDIIEARMYELVGNKDYADYLIEQPMIH